MSGLVCGTASGQPVEGPMGTPAVNGVNSQERSPEVDIYKGMEEEEEESVHTYLMDYVYFITFLPATYHCLIYSHLYLSSQSLLPYPANLPSVSTRRSWRPWTTMSWWDWYSGTWQTMKRSPAKTRNFRWIDTTLLLFIEHICYCKTIL